MPNEKNSLLHANTSKYYWTHRVGNHSSSEYNCYAVSYERNTTLNNKKGESTAYCAWRYELSSRNKIHKLVNNISSKLFVNSPTCINIAAKGDSKASHYY